MVWLWLKWVGGQLWQSKLLFCLEICSKKAGLQGTTLAWPHVLVPLNFRTKKTHLTKFTRLQTEYAAHTRETSSFNTENIINLSQRQLSDNERAVLTKGLNFAVPPKKIPTLDIIAGVEKGLRRIQETKTRLTTSRLLSDRHLWGPNDLPPILRGNNGKPSATWGMIPPSWSSQLTKETPQYSWTKRRMTTRSTWSSVKATTV